MNVDAARRQLKVLYEIAEDVGIRHAVFINFGTLLGCVRQNGFIPWDSDFDIAVRSDWITAKQEQNFYVQLYKPRNAYNGAPGEKGLFSYRDRKARRGYNRRLLWLSMQWELKGEHNCCWFMFPHNGYLYHCKGRRWIKKIGNRPEVKRALPMDCNLGGYSAFAKGNTLSCFDKMKQVKFEGTWVNIPCGYGRLLDEYYPNFCMPKYRGASSRHRLMLVPDWDKPDGWMIVEDKSL